MNETIFEYCPFCDTEVELKPISSVQLCPNCGKLILPCNLCDHDNCDCGNCLLSSIRNEIELKYTQDNI